MPVSSEHVSDLLPEYAESGLRPAGEVEEHLASCVACSAELGTYRSLLSSLAAFRAVEIEPPPGYLERTIRTVRVASVTSRIRSLADRIDRTAIRIGDRFDREVETVVDQIGGTMATLATGIQRAPRTRD